MSNKGSSWIRTTVGSDQECHVLKWGCDMFYVYWLIFDLSTGIFAMLRSKTHALLVVYQGLFFLLVWGKQQWWLWLSLLSPEMLLMSVWNTADESGMGFDVKSEGSDVQIVWSKIYALNILKAVNTKSWIELPCFLESCCWCETFLYF